MNKKESNKLVRVLVVDATEHSVTAEFEGGQLSTGDIISPDKMYGPSFHVKSADSNIVKLTVIGSDLPKSISFVDPIYFKTGREYFLLSQSIGEYEQTI